MEKLKTIKKNIFQRLASGLFLTLVLISCDQYLDVQPKGVQLLTNTEDYDQWLNNSALETSLARELNLLADNVDNPYISNPPASNTDDWVYTWQDQFSPDVKALPVIWEKHYKSIYYFNTVLKGIDEAGGEESEKKSLKGEALLGRAMEYLYLVNLYGKLYDPATSEEDLSIPFVTSVDVSDPIPARNTVQEIYNHIIEDLETAIPILPLDNANNRYRGSVAAAYSVLARAYLYRGDYVKASQNAQSALNNGPNVILDYSAMTGSSGIPILAVRPDAIYARLSSAYYFGEVPTLTFLQAFDTKDLRLKFYYNTNGDYNFDTRGEVQFTQSGLDYTGAYLNWGTSVAEMRLIIAEAAARADDLSVAIDQLDLLRSKRFMAADYIKYDPAIPVKEEVLQRVLDERAFELSYCGMRWFDMRRLDKEGRMPEVTRYDGSGNVIATLSPNSNKYTLKIPVQVLYYNPDWPQNPE